MCILGRLTNKSTLFSDSRINVYDLEQKIEFIDYARYVQVYNSTAFDSCP